MRERIKDSLPHRFFIMKKNLQRIIVTGGSGYLGTHIRRYFSADDFSRRTGSDICNPVDARQIADYDVVIHMAALVDKRPQAAAENFRVNVAGTVNLLEQLRAGQTFIYCSTKDVYGSHIDQYQQVPEHCSTEYCGQGAYEWSKLIGEKYLQFYAKRAGARAAIFRLATVYASASTGNPGGFVSYFARAIRTGEPLRLKMRGTQVRDLLHVDDLARACELFIASSRRQDCYNIGGGAGQAITLYELTQLLAKLIGRSAEVILTDEPVPEQIHYITDISAIAQTLGWRPELDITTGLGKMLADEC
ncbi:MAG: NAD(P)-dependent oxidoreductase [Acidobacteriota bacterium]